MGPSRELKFALEKYWKGTISEEDLLRVATTVEDQAWELQSGISRIAVADQYLYDGILTWTEYLGIIPSRMQGIPAGIQRMFSMARGAQNATALSKLCCAQR
jgi:5-methyltetrahydropteroyltriglutamate--homocysteine methyltransferase